MNENEDVIGKNIKAMEQAIEFTRSQDKVFRVDDTLDKPLELRPSRLFVKRLADYPEFGFFTLGPVYIGAQVDFDIVGQMAALMDVDFQRVVLMFNHDIFPGLVSKQADGTVVSWSNVLEGIPMEYLMELEKFMATQHALNRMTGEFWKFERVLESIIDPLVVDNKDLVGASDSTIIRVFLPSSNVNRTVVSRANSVSDKIFFMRAPPDPEVIKLGEAALGKVQ